MTERRTEVRDTPAPRPEFILWPAYALCLTAALLPQSEELPEAGEALESLRREISPDLARDLIDLDLAGIPGTLSELHWAETGAGQSVDQFLAWVRALPPKHLAAAVASKTRDMQRASLSSPRRMDSLAELESQAQDGGAQERVRALLATPSSVRRFAVSTLTTLWKDHLRAAYEQHEDELRQAVSAFAALPASTHPVDLVCELVGRPVPGLAKALADAKRLILVPLPYLGPYLVSRHATAGSVIAFDALRAFRLHSGLDADLDLASLKVLADETRLRILRFVAEGERFGGDIVTHLGIAQPGVSRHLRLMTASGLLNVRQEGAAKCYSLRREAFDALARRIRDLGRPKPSKGGSAS